MLNEVTMRELDKAIAEANKLKTVYPISKLNEHQKIIYDILERKENCLLGYSMMSIAVLLRFLSLTDYTETICEEWPVLA